MQEIERWGSSGLWSDVVIHNGVANWVEVAEDTSQNTTGQIQQVLSQIDATLTQLGQHRTDLLQVTIYLADLSDAPILNTAWKMWVPQGHAPIRACVQAGLSPGCRVEMIVTAAARSPIAKPSTDSRKEPAMRKYLIEREIPGAGKLSAAELKDISQKSCSVLRGMGPQIQWVQSYVTGDKVYCVYLAASEDLIREHARQGSFPVNRVSEITSTIDPTTAEK